MEPVPPKNPFAWINVDNQHRPAVILHWTRTLIPGMYNLPVWEASCAYWGDDGKPAAITVPEDRISKGSGPAR